MASRASKAFADPFGPEPKENVTPENQTKIISWYQITKYQDIEAVRAFMAANNFSKQQEKNVVARKRFLPKNVFAYCRIQNNGFSIPPQSHAWLMDQLNREAAEVTEEKPKVKSTRMYSLKVERCIEDIEAANDFIVKTNGTLAFVPVIKAYEALTVDEVNQLANHYKPVLEELKAVEDRTDMELVQAYKNLPSAKIHALVNLFSHITDLEETPEPKEQKPRKKRAPNFKKLKYLAEDTNLDLRSVSPASIHGCTSTLIVYNTKYDSVTVYVAEEGKYLEFKRTSVINFDPDRSYTKKAGRSKTLVNILRTGSKKTILHEIENNLKSKPSKASSLISDVVLLVKGFI